MCGDNSGATSVSGRDLKSFFHHLSLSEPRGKSDGYVVKFGSVIIEEHKYAGY